MCDRNHVVPTSSYRRALRQDMWNEELILEGQYVQWIQQDKLRLINQSLDSHEWSLGDVGERRWEVRAVITPHCITRYKSSREQVPNNVSRNSSHT